MYLLKRELCIWSLIKLVFAVTLALSLHLSHWQTCSAQVSTTSSHPKDLQLPDKINVLIVEFEDLECPACATADPKVDRFAYLRRVEVVKRDFLIPGHAWSPRAAIIAHWLDSRASHLGAEYRKAVFANQQRIASLEDIRVFSASFAIKHGLSLPADVDSDGLFAALVRRDMQIARELGVHETPTFFVISRQALTTPQITQCPARTELLRCLDQALSTSGPYTLVNPANNSHARQR